MTTTADKRPATETPPDSKPNSDTLDDPFLDDQLALAHYMTGMLPHEGGEDFWIDPAYYDPNGPTSNLGGAMLAVPVLSLVHRTDDDRPVGLSAREAVRHELRAAERFGVDAFEFYYPWTGDTTTMEYYNSIIPTFFSVAESEGFDVSFTVAVSHPTAGDTERKVDEIGSALSSLRASVGDSDRWLTTPDGRLILATWQPAGLALGSRQYDIADNAQWVQSVADAYDALAAEVDVDVAWLYNLYFASSYPDHTDYVDAVLDHFPGIHGWQTGCDDTRIWDYVAEACASRGRYFMQDVYGDHETGKLYRDPSLTDGIYSGDVAQGASADAVRRWTVWLGLSERFRSGLELVRTRDADGVYVATWNDYGEGHHIAPEINHNFGYAQLLEHSLARWRDTEPAPSDIAIVFFKKYPATATPSPFDIHSQRDVPCGTVTDEVEVVTLLAEPGSVRVNDADPVAVESGVRATRFPVDPGHVDVTVTRDGETLTQFTTPEAITTDPFRTDRLTFAYSSNHEEVYADLYGSDTGVFVSNQYAARSLVDGPGYGRPD